MFAATVVPGALAVLVLAVGLREVPGGGASGLEGRRHRRPRPAVSALPRGGGGVHPGQRERRLSLADARTTGVPTCWLPLAWGALSLLRAVVSAPLGGRVADRVGLARCLSLAWALYALAYLGFGLARSPWALLPVLLVYGLYYGLSEGTERALVASFAGAHGLGGPSVASTS